MHNFRSAIMINPTSSAHDSLAHLSYEANDLESAIDNWRRAFELDQTKLDAQIYLGVTLNLTGNCKEAIDILRKAIEKKT